MCLKKYQHQAYIFWRSFDWFLHSVGGSYNCVTTSFVAVNAWTFSSCSILQCSLCVSSLLASMFQPQDRMIQSTYSLITLISSELTSCVSLHQQAAGLFSSRRVSLRHTERSSLTERSRGSLWRSPRPPFPAWSGRSHEGVSSAKEIVYSLKRQTE